MVGVFQIAPPDGAQSSVPSTFLPAGLGSSGMMEVFQIGRPVLESRATMLPRKVQQG